MDYAKLTVDMTRQPQTIAPYQSGEMFLFLRCMASWYTVFVFFLEYINLRNVSRSEKNISDTCEIAELKLYFPSRDDDKHWRETSQTNQTTAGWFKENIL